MSSLNTSITSATSIVTPTLQPHFTPAPTNAADVSNNLTILFGIIATFLTIAGLIIAMLQLLQIRHLGGNGDLSHSDIDLELGSMDAQQDGQSGGEDLDPGADGAIGIGDDDLSARETETETETETEAETERETPLS